jgi:cytochrome c-type biogenesis protein CcmH
MTAFLLLAALLLAGALLLVLPPLMGRRSHRSELMAAEDQAVTAVAVLREQLADLEAERAAGRVGDQTYVRSRDELERRVLEEGAREAAARPAWHSARAWALVTALGVPAAALGLYLVLGNPEGLDPAKIAGGSQSQFSQEQIEGMVATLAARMEKEPDNLEGWMMLARSYTMLGRADEAEKAYSHLAEKMPDNAQVLADWADAMGAAHGRTLVGDPEKLIAKALALDPQNFKALALAGSAAFEKGDYAGASQHWENLLTQLPPGEEIAESVRASVAEARAKAGLPPLEAAPQTAAVDGSLKLSGEVRLAPALAAQAKPDDTVFIFVRGQGGPPFAALRLTVAQLPAKFDFTGAPLMLQGRSLPAQVIVGARISRSGEPSGAPGDLEGFSGPVAAGAQGVAVTVDKVRP